MSGSKERRTRGNTIAVVLLLLVVVAGALGVNYVRNTQIDEAQEKQNRPYARFKTADLEVLAEGYRMELASAEKRYGGARVAVRERHHLSDQIQEFERVQRQAQKNRDKALDVAQIRQDLEAIEAEQKRRVSSGADIGVHLGRMFRL